MNENVVLKVKDLNKHYGKFHALKDVSFDVHENEIVGFVGPNGSGKSTTMKCIASLIIPEKGEIEIEGISLFKHREQVLAMQGSLIEGPGLFENMSGMQNLELMAALRKVSKARIAEIIDFMDLGVGLKRKVGKYSLGMKQRLAIGIVLLSKPKFIILDEPTNGLDLPGVIDLRNMMVKLAKEEGVSILFSSHQLGEIAKVADRIIFINNGTLVPFNTQMDNAKIYRFKLQDMNDNIIKTLDIEGISEVEIDGNSVIFLSQTTDSFNNALQKINENYQITDIINEVVDIEQLYLNMLGD